MKKTIVCPHCGEKIRLEQSDADRAIELYYHKRVQGARTTIQDIADITGMSYEALKKHKQRYDAAGGWGSKKAKHTDNKD